MNIKNHLFESMELIKDGDKQGGLRTKKIFKKS